MVVMRDFRVLPGSKLSPSLLCTMVVMKDFRVLPGSKLSPSLPRDGTQRCEIEAWASMGLGKGFAF